MMQDNYEYDLAIHLGGQQSIPNLLGIKSIAAKRHLILTSSKTDFTFKQLKSRASDQCLENLRIPDPFDMPNIYGQVSNLIKNQTGLVALNVTGGTKPMALATINAAMQFNNSHFFYFDTQNKRCLKWDKNMLEPNVLAINGSLSIDDFIGLSMFTIQKAGTDLKLIQSRKNITRYIWKCRKFYPQIQKEAQRYLSGNIQSINVQYQNASLKYKNGKFESFYLGDYDFSSLSEILDIKYLAGGWFEEFVYWTLQPHLVSGKLKEIRFGLSVMYSLTPDQPAQEFDLLATDGLRLFLLECKAGKIEQQNLDKLENITEKFGGVLGLGILVARWPQSSTDKRNVPTIERTKKSQKYACVHGDKLDSILFEQLFKLEAGNTYS